MLTSVDLFAGGGGLTLGLKRAGFGVIVAVENDEHACATFRMNHPEVRLLPNDIRDIEAAQWRWLAADVGGVDLLAGCPPCQGFTSLTSKYRRDDERNYLVMEMCRVAESLRPRVIMMENVVGLGGRGEALYGGLRARLENLGYELTEGLLEVADFGVPQHRKRLVLLGGLGFSVKLPTPTHSREGLDGLAPWRTVREAIGDMAEPITLAKAKKGGGHEPDDWHVVRNMSELNLQRLRVAKAGDTWSNIPEELRPPCHRGEYRGFTNVYGRMEWDQPSPTITGGCTTFSKGRFGHPVEDRTISVREAALLQTFPKSYKFDTPFMEKVCNIIGNALPCDFAEAVSRQCRAALEEHESL